MASGDQVAVPAEHGLGAHEQPYPAQSVAGEVVYQGREEGSFGRIEAHLLLAELALQHHDLMAQCHDLHILAVVAYR